MSKERWGESSPRARATGFTIRKSDGVGVDNETKSHVVRVAHEKKSEAIRVDHE